MQKRQRGQYMTPRPLARRIVSDLELANGARILEPSCGDGSFLAAIIERLQVAGEAPRGVSLVGVEIDPLLVRQSRELVAQETQDKSRSVHVKTDICQADFFQSYLSGRASDNGTGSRETLLLGRYDLIVGNPPFGGTFDSSIEDTLDAHLGYRLGMKVKKETYAFFIVACIDLLRDGGRLMFICSDSLLTIPTMTGLRHFLMESGYVRLRSLEEFSGETTYPMVVLDFTKGRQRGKVVHNTIHVDREAILKTPNLSWRITPDLAKLFTGTLLGNYFVASSGMTTGRNELFVRAVDEQQHVTEHLRFEIVDAPVTVEHELQRARLGKLPERRRQMLEEAERLGRTEPRLLITQREETVTVQLPDVRYRPYNKANNRIVYSDPTHYIYWENEGQAVLTYKKTGNWYLRGVGGQPYFGREGLTWQLVASRFVARYLPPGYILDSGAPCAFLREGIDRAELFFVLAWLLSPLANRTLKTVVNHTRNIQSKDLERMPYPWWVCSDARSKATTLMEDMIAAAQSGVRWTWKDDCIHRIGELFEFPTGGSHSVADRRANTPKDMDDLFDLVN